jgi:hypothetical protein
MPASQAKTIVSTSDAAIDWAMSCSIEVTRGINREGREGYSCSSRFKLRGSFATNT